MIDYKQWKENVYDAIKTIADKPFQEEVWLGKNPNYASSFWEVNSILFDDNGFDDFFWEEKHISQFDFSPALLNELKELKNLMDNYKEKQRIKNETDEEILKDPNWDKIINQAKVIIELWHN